MKICTTPAGGGEHPLADTSTADQNGTMITSVV